MASMMAGHDMGMGPSGRNSRALMDIGDMGMGPSGRNSLALMDFGGGGAGMQQSSIMIGGSGMGEGFMMSSTQCFDSSNPANNYSRTQTAQFGPNGMMEARESLRDGRRGFERMGLRRQMGDSYAQMERRRDMASGEESSQQTAHNIEDDDIDRFDRQWMAAASQSLPTYRTQRVAELGAGPAPPGVGVLAIEDRPAPSRSSQSRPRVQTQAYPAAGPQAYQRQGGYRVPSQAYAYQPRYY
uniref:Uncharacterized protein n=1 Tax=Eutreptiella gymnastica TaxID=73025 RepID=A0A7S4CXK6_9EUGL